MDTSGPSGLATLLGQSVGAIALAAAVATPTGHTAGAAAAPRTPIFATQIAVRGAAVGELYGSLDDLCDRLGAMAHSTNTTRPLRGGIAVQVLRVDEARCNGFTIPMLRVRVDAPGTPLDGRMGFVERGVAVTEPAG